MIVYKRFVKKLSFFFIILVVSFFASSTIDFTRIRRKTSGLRNPVSDLTCPPIYPKEFSLLLIISTCKNCNFTI